MAVVTGAQGQATFKLSDDGQSITYKLNVANIENVTQAHIHLAPTGRKRQHRGMAGTSAPPQILIPGRTDGNLAEGTITAANLVNDLAVSHCPRSSTSNQATETCTLTFIRASTRQERSAASSDRVADVGRPTTSASAGPTLG